MNHPDGYFPDPPSGLGYTDFRAARARFFARLSEQAEIARLKRAISSTVEPPAGVAGSGGRRTEEASARERSSNGGAHDGAVRTLGEASG